MKKIVLSAVAASLLSACTETDLVTNTNALVHHAPAKAKGVGAASSPNPFDGTGALYGQLYENYAPPADSGAGITDSLAVAVRDYALGNEAFAALAEGQDPVPDTAVLQGISDGAAQSPAAALAQAGLSPALTDALNSLATTLHALKNAGAGFDAADTALADFELGIPADTALTAGDAATLYATVSILRNDLEVQRRKKRKDRDWEMSVGHIAATAYGASQNAPEAILYGLITAAP